MAPGLNSLNDRGGGSTSQASEHVTACVLNVAACYLKTQQPEVVLYCCDQVIFLCFAHRWACYR